MFIVTPLETITPVSRFSISAIYLFTKPGMDLHPVRPLHDDFGWNARPDLMPLICLGTFLVETRDPSGAAVALWWMAESFMDIAPYINDARAMDLIVIGGVTGKETDGHDWNNILTMLGLLEWDHRLAQLAYNFGIVLMLVSFAWEAWLLLRHYRRLST